MQSFQQKCEDPVFLAQATADKESMYIKDFLKKYNTSYQSVYKVFPYTPRKVVPSIEVLQEAYERIGTYAGVGREFWFAENTIKNHLCVYKSKADRWPICVELPKPTRYKKPVAEAKETIKQPLPEHIEHKYDYSDKEKYWEIVTSYWPMRGIRLLPNTQTAF